ncbi:hypothetical protein PWW31_01975 [Vibrio harveyi]|nr:hypothetical protein PWW31_01975 [Vibrio harveyi]
MDKSEKLTRIELIDTRLKKSGWKVDDPSSVAKEFNVSIQKHNSIEEPYTQYDGHQFADYVLLGKDGLPLAVIEAKKPVRMRLLVANKQSSIAITFKSNLVESCLFAFTPTVMISTSGISKTRRPEEW